MTLLMAFVGLTFVPATLARYAAADEALLQPPSEVFIDDDFNSATSGWQTTHFDRIQDGVNAVAAGGNVNVAAGLYTETIAITKILTVTGAGTDTVVQSDSGTCFDTNTEAGATVIDVQSGSVILEGLYIDGRIPAACGAFEVPRTAYGVKVRSQVGFELRNTTVVSAVYGVFIQDSSAVRITANTIVNAGIAGIGAGMYFTDSERRVEDNVVRDSPEAIGVVVANGGQGFFQRNRIMRVKTGLLANFTGLAALDNTFDGNGVDEDVGIKLIRAGGGGSSTILTRNVVEGFTRGIDVRAGSQLLQDNKIRGPGKDTVDSIGIRFSTEVGPGDVENITVASLSGNLIVNHERGIVFHEPEGNLSAIIFNAVLNDANSVRNINTIAQYKTFALELENTNHNIRAAYNNWGVTSADRVEEVIWHKNDDPSLGRVLFEPITGVPALMELTADPDTLRPNGTDTSVIRAQVFFEQQGTETVTVTVAPGLMVGFEVLQGPGTIPYAFDEAESGGVAKTGSWSQQSNDNASEGALMRSNSAGSTVAFDFTGTAASLVYAMRSDAGIANLAIDGGAVFSDTLDMYSDSEMAEFNERIIATGLTDGSHTLTVEVSGNKNTSSSNTYLYVDAFRSGLTTDEQGLVTGTFTAGSTEGIAEVLAVAVSESGNITDTIAVTISQATPTPTPTSTSTPTSTPTATPTPTPTATSTQTPTPTGTSVATATPTPTLTPSATRTPPRESHVYLPLVARNLENVVPKIEVLPADERIDVGGTTRIELRISAVTDLFAAEVRLSFDPALLEVVDANAGESGIQIETGTFPDPNNGSAVINRADNTAGIAEYVVTVFRPNPPVSGSGPLAYITFRGKALGDSPITFQRAVLSDQEASPIPAAVNGGVIHVGPAPTATPTVTPTRTPTVTPGGPTPTSTPGEPTPTSTATPHAPTPTPTPTTKPTPGACQQIVLNPGFEQNGNWTISRTPRQARYTTMNRFTGQRSILMGLLPFELLPPENDSAYSSVWQAVHIPSDADSAGLSFRYWPGTEESSTTEPGIAVEQQQALVFDATFSALRAVVLKTRSDDQDWRRQEYDLTEFTGQTIVLYFNAINYRDNRQTWWYVDDVFVEVCGSSSPLYIPPQPQEGPDEEMLLNLLIKGN
ncbi:MAG: right-handed parallel beta-helix repeat-containing protein [Anaerolineae bacterium]